MPSNKPRHAFHLLLFLAPLLLMALAAAIAIPFLQRETKPSASRALTEPTRAEIEEYVNLHAAVIDNMPQDPQGQAVLAHIVDLWCSDTNIAKIDALPEIALTFRDSGLGLAALEQYAASSADPAAAAPLFQHIMAQYPDSRLACMALDRLLKHDPAHTIDLCTVAAARPATALPAFALMKKGDFLIEQQDARDAVLAWLQAWLIDSRRGPVLHKRLRNAWQTQGNWYDPLLLDESLSGDKTACALAKRLIQRHDKVPPSLATALQALPTAAPADLPAAYRALADTLEQASLPPEDRFNFALAAYLHQPAPASDAGSMKSRLLERTQCEQQRRRLLTMIDAGWKTNPPDLAAAFRLKLMRRMLMANNPDEAGAIIAEKWKDPSLSKAWRERLAEQHAHLLNQEMSRPEESAALFAAYTDTYPDAPSSYRLKAGHLFLQAHQFASAQTQLQKVIDTAPTADLAGAATFLLGLGLISIGERTAGEQHLQEAINLYPEGEYVPKALHLLAKEAVTRGDYAAARTFYHDIVENHPLYEYAEQARLFLSDLDTEEK